MRIALLTFITLVTALMLSIHAYAAPFAMRVLYAPGHFGNSYEVMGEREMADVLREAQYAGFNHYADWFDTVDCADPFTDDHHNLAAALWDRKKTNFNTAQELGLGCHLVVTPNHVYLDQVRPAIAATKGDGIFGQLVCPSTADGRAVILQNYENLFRDLANAGVTLDGLWAAPYDYGGCACDACDPWIVTFAKLSKEIHAIAEEHHPDIAMHAIGWWWSDEEHALFAKWVNEHAPGWIKSIALHIPYDKTDVSDVPLPDGCERQAFVHIGYGEEAQPRDVYGHMGPVSAPDRIEKTVTALKAHGCTGVMAYSEGVFDDLNKVVLANLASGLFETADEALETYARRYFRATFDNAADWAAWLRDAGWPYVPERADALQRFEALAAGRFDGTWRIKQWMHKAKLMELNAAIMAESEWNEKRLALVDDFWSTQSGLYRSVWGLGPLRHILARRFSPMPWYRDWATQVSKRSLEEIGDK